MQNKMLKQELIDAIKKVYKEIENEIDKQRSIKIRASVLRSKDTEDWQRVWALAEAGVSCQLHSLFFARDLIINNFKDVIYDSRRNRQ